MDKAYWRGIIERGFTLQPTDDAPALTNELLDYLGSPDPEFRDEIAFTILEEWIHRGYYTEGDMRALISRLAQNLREGLGETNSDSVFLRSFSSLVLAELVYEDAKRQYLQDAEVIRLLEQVLAYFPAERDLRGYVTNKGWAHAVAHGADVLWMLALNRNVAAKDLERILNCISSQIAPEGAEIFVWNEDQRLIRAVMGVLGRNALPITVLEPWVRGLVFRDGQPLSVALAFEGRPPVVIEDDWLSILHNTRNFLMGLRFHLVEDETSPEVTDDLLKAIAIAARPLLSA